jgi:sigma-E factor negative regulatory protein RseB
MRAVVVAALLSALVPGMPAVGRASEDQAATAGALLGDMSRAMQALDYQGSFIYQHGGRTDALRVFHLGGHDERERVISLSGPRSEIVRHAGTITCIDSVGHPTIFTNGTGPLLVPLVPDAVAGNLAAGYRIELGSADRVAGYDARIIEVSARDAYRYSYRFWVDQASRILLRSMLIGTDRHPLEQFMFIALEVGTKPSTTDLRAGHTEGKARMPPDEIALAAPRWQVADLPAGFVLSRSQRLAQGPSGAEHLMYSDGLASVSVYIEPHGGKPAVDESRESRGALNVFAMNSDGVRITALGDVPAATVERLVRSVRPVAPPAG